MATEKQTIILFDDGIATENVQKYGKMIDGTLVVHSPPNVHIIGYLITKHMPSNIINIKVFSPPDSTYEMLSLK